MVGEHGDWQDEMIWTPEVGTQDQCWSSPYFLSRSRWVFERIGPLVKQSLVYASYIKKNRHHFMDTTLPAVSLWGRVTDSHILVPDVSEEMFYNKDTFFSMAGLGGGLSYSAPSTQGGVGCLEGDVVASSIFSAARDKMGARSSRIEGIILPFLTWDIACLKYLTSAPVSPSGRVVCKSPPSDIRRRISTKINQ